MKKKEFLSFILLIATPILNIKSQEKIVATIQNISPKINIKTKKTENENNPTNTQATSEVKIEEDAEEIISSGPETERFPESIIGGQGNWVKKQKWLKESLKLNGKINNLLDKIQKSKTKYQSKFKEIDNELDVFYKEQGLSHGKISELFNSLDQYIEKKKQKEIEIAQLSEKETGITGEFEIKLDIIEKQIKDKKTDLDQLKLDMKSIEDLDKSIKARLKKVDEQITISIANAEKATELTDEIWSIIDDTKARAKYYQIKNISAKMKAIQNYLQKTLLTDFDNVIKTTQSQINKIKTEIINLEKKEFIIRNRTERIKKISLSKLENQAKSKTQEKKTDPKKIITKSWHTKLYDYIVTATAKTYIFIENIFHSKKSPEKTIVKDHEEIKTSQKSNVINNQPQEKDTSLQVEEKKIN